MTTAVAKPAPSDIATLVEANRTAILQALPKTIKADRFLRVCLNAISRNPELQKCTASSLYAGIMQSAQFGLEISLMNQAHLVPYWNADKHVFEAQFQIGYLGLRDLGERYGDVKDGDAQVVHEKDLFDYGQGDTPYLTHKPSKDQHRGEIVHFYCWARPKEGALKVAVMSKEEVKAHRDQFVRRKKDGSFGPAWTLTFEAMGLKTVIRRCYKFLARSPELREAIALDELQEIQIPQNLGLELEQAQHAEARMANAQQLDTVQTQLEHPVTRREDRAATRPMKQDIGPGTTASQQASDAPAPSHADADRLAGKPAPVADPTPQEIHDLRFLEWMDAIEYLAADPNRNDILKVVLLEFKSRSCAVLPVKDRSPFLLRVFTLCMQEKIPCRALLTPM